MLLESGQTLLCIGDSITDCGRRDDPDALGNGYVRLLRDMLWSRHPEIDATVLNRGIGGNTVRHLEQRWETDVIAERPDCLSISIGVNDVWRQLQTPRNPEEVLIDEFEATYRRLLDGTLHALPDCRLILCEPTINGETADTPHNGLTGPYVECVHTLASEYGALLAPMNQAFWRVINANPSRQWTRDGVHPIGCGHMLMAVTLYDTLNKSG